MSDLTSMQTTGDRFVDLSLRILTLVVGAVLVACLVLLFYRWSAPSAATPAINVVPVTPKVIAPLPVASQQTEPAPEVLMAPGKMFECVVHGRKLFSDRPCPEVAGVKR